MASPWHGTKKKRKKEKEKPVSKKEDLEKRGEEWFSEDENNI